MVEKESKKKVFNNAIAEAISRTDPSIQFQSNILATWCMLFGVAGFMFYLGFIAEMNNWMRILSLVNMFFMMLFMYSNLVMAYQQLRSYKEAKALQEEFRNYKEV